jgi:hypothetical protein
MKTNISIVVCLWLLGCSPAVLPKLSADNQNIDESSKSYCQRLSYKSDTKAKKYLVTGIITGIIASGAVITGTAVGPNTSDGANWAEKSRNALIISAGGVLALPATLFLMRSKDSNSASAKSGQAMGLEEEKAMSTCLEARAELVNDRSALADYAQKDLTDRIAPLQVVQETATENATRARAEAASETDPEKKMAAEQRAKEADALGKSAADSIILELQKDQEQKRTIVPKPTD